MVFQIQQPLAQHYDQSRHDLFYDLQEPTACLSVCVSKKYNVVIPAIPAPTTTSVCISFCKETLFRSLCN